ncbi:hypothetical protein KSD_17290 [Ktedonobacter sp. SOSP1-85]|uniref:methylation-associated defense system protein MAD7 n=1 Tax=Ktedonobacter sp. SOSP1-85 TaxID=2778367 RepID=UPI0019152F6F|nr:hypothetical protein [Ktedonobacter sp. SOSP1-85]GHO73958.1 hypothetical protein KSD_17290 [Ktedonobacter sp. SOSP1-85]
MKLKLPKSIVGVKFPRVCTIELNGFDIDLLLPSLFFAILSEGRGKKHANNPKNIAKFIDNLIQHESLEGFNDPEGRKVLERFVRTALITTGGVGRSGKDEQITSIIPYTLLAHKPGFPTTSSLIRGVDTFIYQQLREQLGDNNLRNFVKMVFGRGVVINPLPELGGKYDGETKLDTLTRLSIAFLDGFENTRPGREREKNVSGPCPRLAKEFATDLLRYLFEYHQTMPIQAFTHHLLILINFELFNYTLKLVHSVNELVQNPAKLPAAMDEDRKISPPQLYLDFTEAASGYSQEMAKACVRRDIETYQQFLESNLLLRQLNVYVEKLKRNPRKKAALEKVLSPTLTGAEYLQGLLLLRHDPEIRRDIAALASSEEDEIRQLNTQEGEEDDPEALSWLDAMIDTAEDEVERAITLLVEAQRGNAVKNIIQWYWSAGGLKKPQGILRGAPTNRKSWRYAPTNDVLAALVQLAAVRLGKPTKQENGESVQPIRLQEFLQFLEERFGILVDRPPAPFEGAEYTAAARDNLRAMLRRLRQMGIFRDLSDDFTVQRLHPPYAGQELKGVRA